MDLSQFTDVDVGDNTSMLEFLDANAYAHETINGAILDLGIVLSHFPLFTDAGATPDYNFVHNAEHVAIRAALGLSGVNDFSTVDWKDKTAAEGFFDTHAQEHALIALTLGL